jgi:hypothetical protein
MKALAGWRTALAYILLLLGLITLAMTLPAMTWLGWGALLMIIPGLALAAAGLIMLLMLIARARR